MTSSPFSTNSGPRGRHAQQSWALRSSEFDSLRRASPQHGRRHLAEVPAQRGNRFGIEGQDTVEHGRRALSQSCRSAPATRLPSVMPSCRAVNVERARVSDWLLSRSSPCCAANKAVPSAVVSRS